MRALILASILLSSSVAWALAGGTATDDAAIKTALGLDFSPYQSALDTPEIPIGPRVAITCGHCVSDGNGTRILHPPLMQADTIDTANAFDSLPSGNYGLPFFEKANYAYDLTLIILGEGEQYFGPYMTVARSPVRLHEVLTFLGKGMDVSAPGHLCDGFSYSHQFDYAPFQVIDFYSQQVGFILTGRPAATCTGDSGGYYFRKMGDGSIQLVGINSWGTEDGIQQNPEDGVVRNFQGYLSGANDLTSPGIRAWLSQMASENGVGICGINKDCAPVSWPFGKGLERVPSSPSLSRPAYKSRAPAARTSR